MGMNMAQMMKQARKVQEQLEKAQENIKDIRIDASAGGGMIKATATGDMQIESLTIDPEAVDPEDVDFLQDMVLAAVNEALRGANDAANAQMGAAAGGMNLPNIPGMPF